MLKLPKLFSNSRLRDELLSKRPLPIGVSEFEEWSCRIIEGAMLPATKASQQFTLANMICHLSPTEDFKEDAYFIKGLRKFAANQVADSIREKIRDEEKARLLAEQQQAVTPVQSSDVTQAVGASNVLELPKV